MHEVTTGVQIVLPQHCNGYEKPRLFGGQLMAWIDIIAAVAARRYACCGRSAGRRPLSPARTRATWRASASAAPTGCPWGRTAARG